MSTMRLSAGRIVTAVLSALLAGGNVRTRADSLVPIGKPAPDWSLTTLEGGTVRLGDLRDRPVLMLFGELYNANSIAACKDVTEVLAQPASAELQAAAYLIVTQQVSAGELKAQAESKGVTLPILQDPRRRAFSDYRVVVLPSLVVIDRGGVTVLPCAGYPLSFQDMVADALLYAGGKLSAGDYERLRSAADLKSNSDAAVRARRLAALGEQLARRGSTRFAMDRLRDALALDADCVPARIALGNCLLREGELATAEQHFRHVLKTEPESVDANLGLIHIQVIRGGAELDAAAERLPELLQKHGNDPKVIFLAGVVEEASGNAEAALGHYRRAAELLLYGQEQRRDLK